MPVAAPARSDPPAWRIVAAFLIVPGAAAVLMAILMPGYDGIGDPLERIWRSAFAFAALGAYPTTVILGIPAFFILRQRFDPRPVNCALVGAIVAALPWLLILLTLGSPDNASIGRRTTVVEGALTTYGWFTHLLFVGQIAILGAVGGLLFWLIAASGSRAERAGRNGGAPLDVSSRTR